MSREHDVQTAGLTHGVAFLIAPPIWMCFFLKVLSFERCRLSSLLSIWTVYTVVHDLSF
jgi:hypothetical protein